MGWFMNQWEPLVKIYSYLLSNQMIGDEVTPHSLGLPGTQYDIFIKQILKASCKCEMHDIAHDCKPNCVIGCIDFDFRYHP